MFLIFALISIFLVIIDKFYKKSFLSPVFIYCVSWLLMVCSYELKLIVYYDLTPFTYLVITLSEILFCLFCWFGMKSIRPYALQNSFEVETIKNEKKRLFITIIFCSIVGAIPILHGFLSLMSDFNYNFLRVLVSSDYLYAQHIEYGNLYLKIPYLHAFAYAGLVYSSIYLKKYGFKLFIAFPLLLIGLLTIITGSRYFIVLGALQFICPLFLSKRTKKSIFKKKRLIAPIVFAVSAIVLLFVVYRLSTAGRSKNIYDVAYASPFLKSLMDIFGNGVFKTYHYFSSPVGILNAYLKDSYVLPGRETFAFFYRIFKKLGFNVPTEVGRPYYIPIASNAGTFLKSFMIDFGPFFIVAVVIFAYITGRSYMKSMNGMIQASAIYSVVFSLLAMGFYSWYLSETVYWIEIFVFIFISIYLRKKPKVSYNVQKSVSSIV